MSITWNILPFHQLSADEFHDIIALRINVFVVEQNCPYPELDGKDKYAYHVFCVSNKNNLLIATARILPKGVSHNEVSIGRVVTHQSKRQNRIGIRLMEKCMEFIQHQFPKENVRISAQSHLIPFYNKFGFKSTGKAYLEDNIPHTEMLFEVK